MDKERLKWITSKPCLDSWEVKVSFSETPTGTLATVFASGQCNRRRGNLWTHSETVAVAPGRYTVHDLVTHLSMAVEQDRPTNDRELTRSLCGEAWEQPELPW